MAGTIVDHAVWLAGRRRLQAFAKHTGEQMMDASSKHAGVRPPLFPQMPSVWSLDCLAGLGMDGPCWALPMRSLTVVGKIEKSPDFSILREPTGWLPVWGCEGCLVISLFLFIRTPFRGYRERER